MESQVTVADRAQTVEALSGGFETTASNVGLFRQACNDESVSRLNTARVAPTDVSHSREQSEELCNREGGRGLILQER